eukprot:TRINITY_DN6465_c0_g1_i1.p1 TRINITY_DN6465_c0_g1~~TRINITY_DN6465_c0_g1_i1.p1  ORF type:complete len:174 (+),score=38.19 TRINITY_DN6465_c0_g1_i1:47-568(+)
MKGAGLLLCIVVLACAEKKEVWIYTSACGDAVGSLWAGPVQNATTGCVAGYYPASGYRPAHCVECSDTTSFTLDHYFPTGYLGEWYWDKQPCTMSGWLTVNGGSGTCTYSTYWMSVFKAGYGYTRCTSTKEVVYFCGTDSTCTTCTQYPYALGACIERYALPMTTQCVGNTAH